jgi:hypothetical protein
MSPASTAARPELTGAFPADVDPARLPSTFAQVTALRSNAEWSTDPTHFGYPHRVHEKAPVRRFRRSGAL